jgi:hypothetical protein
MTSLTVLLGLAVVAAQTPGATAGETPAVALRRYHEMERDVSAALRSEARAVTPTARVAAVQQMCQLYRELASDPRLEASDVLKGYKTKLWSRLTRIERELEQRVARQASAASGRAASPRATSDTEFLAMREASALAASQSNAQYRQGGAGEVSADRGAAFGGGTVNDHAQELIELIQRTIRPNSWDVHGGQGSMFYFRPLMALVVRATSEVHGDVGGLLRALRRAGN